MIIFLIDSLITFKVNNLHGLNKAYFCSSFHCVKRLWKQLLHKLLKYWSTKNKRKIFDRLPFVYKNVRIYLLYHSRPWVKKNVSFARGKYPRGNTRYSVTRAICGNTEFVVQVSL